MLGYFHHKVRSTPWLGRIVLKSIPDIKWHLQVEPVGRMAVRLREHRMFWLRPGLNHEGFMLGALQRLVRPGDEVWDIGANIGLYSRVIVQCFGAGHVVAFEPCARNRRLLEENVGVNGCRGKVSVMGCAIGDHDGYADFQIDDLTSNTGTLDAVANGSASQSRMQYGLPPAMTKVPIQRIDTLIEKERNPAPDVVKIDVEGAEKMVLDGADQLLAAHKPRLAVELHGADVARQVLKKLWSCGYHCFGRIVIQEQMVYREIVADDLAAITAKQSLRYIAASLNADELKEPIADYRERK